MLVCVFCISMCFITFRVGENGRLGVLGVVRTRENVARVANMSGI